MVIWRRLPGCLDVNRRADEQRTGQLINLRLESLWVVGSTAEPVGLLARGNWANKHLVVIMEWLLLAKLQIRNYSRILFWTWKDWALSNVSVGANPNWKQSSIHLSNREFFFFFTKLVGSSIIVGKQAHGESTTGKWA